MDSLLCRSRVWWCAAVFAHGSFLIGCSSESPKDALDRTDRGALRGELGVYVARFDDGRTETSYTLRVNGDQHDERQLVFETLPEAGLAPGAKLDV